MLRARSIGHGTQVPAHDLPDSRSTCSSGVEVDQQERQHAGHPRDDSWSKTNKEDRESPSSRPSGKGDERTAEASKADVELKGVVDLLKRFRLELQCPQYKI